MSHYVKENLQTSVKQIGELLNGHLTSSDQSTVQVVMPEAGPSGRDLIARLITTGIGLVGSLVITYFGIRVLASALDPTSQEKQKQKARAKQIMKTLQIPTTVNLTEYELCVAANLVDPNSLTTSWEDIGGLSNVIQELKESVILPFKRPDFFANSKIFQAPKGVLLYGPPGCGKTMLGRATAKAAGARFINLQVSTLFDKWYGESQKRAEAVFSLAYKLQPAIIFIDEIDSFLRSRDAGDHESTAMIKTQFMTFWDGLSTQSDVRVMIIGATNRPADVDAAILRRMPTQIYIGKPDVHQRKRILDVILREELVADEVYDQVSNLALRTDGFSGSDLRELCRNAAMARVRSLLQQSDMQDELDAADRTLTMQDFEAALKRMNNASNTMTTEICVD